MYTHEDLARLQAQSLKMQGWIRRQTFSPADEKTLREVRGDAVWLDIDSIVNAILRGTTPAHVARRFWFNNIVSAADRWADPPAIEAATPLPLAIRGASSAADLTISWCSLARASSTTSSTRSARWRPRATACW